MTTVSILIPAYKEQFLCRALASAQNQTFQDLEILVGDDTPDAALEDSVQSLRDPRIRYFHHGFQKGTRNAAALMRRASGKYIKWLFDDDVLMPQSVESLYNALVEQPQSAMAFHGRVIIDESDQVKGMPRQVVGAGEKALVARSYLTREMVSKLDNFIGEPSNTMFNRDHVDFETMFDYRSWKLDFLGDVAMFLNLSEQAPLVAVGGYLSGFRRHSAQSSDGASANFSAGLFEWELMLRGEAERGYLPPEALQTAQRHLQTVYTNFRGKFPELDKLLANLGELTELPPQDLYSSPSFVAALSDARAAVAARVDARRAALKARGEARIAALLNAQSANLSTPERPLAGSAKWQEKLRGATPHGKFCVLCEQPVQVWRPHPLAKHQREFMEQVESVGSTLLNYECPNCQCNDRDRHLWLYIHYSGALDNASRKRILHIAPEMRLEPRIRRLEPLEYVAGDLHPRQPNHRKINVEALEFEDGYFDLIICNHVLEHVNDPARALAEFSRCLAPNGKLIAQTPYSPALRYTFELNRPVTPEFATRYFGQSDHVRLFGADIVDQFRASGLSGDLFPHHVVLGDIDAATVGCNPREPYFFFAKGDAPVLPLAVHQSVESSAG
ncbi:glycosyltransferase [Paraburkholderia bannensis]|uniref:glycosyltransferase n=1 Tax=Paraburkholderia bannensis TaxID=765414 RepID=UPI002AB67AAC|nr:glycosyltransferase [Paraburkholderia bannensis]